MTLCDPVTRAADARKLLEMGIISKSEHAKMVDSIRDSMGLLPVFRPADHISFASTVTLTYGGVGTVTLTDTPKPTPPPAPPAPDADLRPRDVGMEIAETCIEFPSSRRHFANLINKAIADEREACAKVADTAFLSAQHEVTSTPGIAKWIRDQIRQRGAK